MKPLVFSWLLPSALGILLLSSPARAATLESWRFDTNQNRLYFTTQGGVQPKAQLIANPTRLVIDLPGTILGRPMVNQPVTKEGFESIRVGQFESDTTRMVIELSPGYTIDPQQVQFRGVTPNEWTVELPTPQLLSAGSGSASRPQRVNEEPSNDSQPQAAAGEVQIENVQVTPDGFFIRTSGAQPEIQVQRNGDSSLYIDLQGATVSSEMRWRDQLLNRHGVGRLSVKQLNNSPPVVRVTLVLTNPNSDWEATVSNLGGVIVLPQGEGTAAGRGDNTSARTPSSDRQIEIEGVEFQTDSDRLLVRSDAPFTYTSGWDRSSGAYRIVIPSAKLANRVKPPTPTNRSSFLWVRFQQEDPDTVAILVQPAAGVRIGQLTQPSPQLLALPFERAATTSIPPSGTSFPVPPAQTTPYPSQVTRPRNGRLVVAIDAGHGGGDPGAIGIGGIQEKDIVLPISEQVAAILEKSGVQVIMTRRDDREIDLPPRVQLANRVNADIFVSIHANAIDMSRPDVNGIETYYYASGDRLANTIHNSILQMTGARDRRVRQARFYVLRHTSMPAVLLEVGFVTGAEDAPRLASPDYQSQMAAAIARGILQYLQNP